MSICLLSLAGVDLDKTAVVALEATLAGFAVWMYRGEVGRLMGDVHQTWPAG